MDTKTYLGELRISACEPLRDNEPLMKRLIRSLNPLDALMVALKQVSSFLPTFENLHPDSTWPRDWVEAAGTFKPIEYRAHSFRFYDDEFSDDSSIAFISAIGILDSGFRAYYENREGVPEYLAASRPPQ